MAVRIKTPDGRTGKAQYPAVSPSGHKVWWDDGTEGTITPGQFEEAQKNRNDLRRALEDFRRSVGGRLNKYGTFWPRLWAGLIDGVVLSPLTFVSNAVFAHASSPWLVIPWYLVDSCSVAAYSIYLHGRFGQTLGKRAVGVVVLDVSERPLSMRQACMRDIAELVAIPIAFLVDLPQLVNGINPEKVAPAGVVGFALAFVGFGWFAIELVTMLTNDKRRALHDLIAGSVVVNKAWLTRREPSAVAAAVASP